MLTNSPNPRKYWSVLKTRLKNEGSEVTTKCSQLKMLAPDGKIRLRDAMSIENIFRLIESVLSPKAEVFCIKWHNYKFITKEVINTSIL